MKKDKKVKNSVKIDKKVKMDLSKSAFDNFLHIAGNTIKQKKKINKKK